jgi:hypothetical protein
MESNGFRTPPPLIDREAREDANPVVVSTRQRYLVRNPVFSESSSFAPTKDATSRVPMPSTVSVTSNRMMSEHYFDPRGIFGCADGPSLQIFFGWGYSIRFVRAFDTGAIKEFLGFEQ